MGWTYCERPDGQTIKEFFARRFGWDSPTTTQRLVGCSVVALRTAYLAIRQTDKTTGVSLINAVVCQLDYAPHDRFNQGFKDVEESMGPIEDACPRKILDLLSPVEDLYEGGNASDWAAAWRARCQTRIERAAKRPSLKTGAYLIFDEPMAFASGEKRAVFYIRDARRRVFTDSSGRHPLRYSISRARMERGDFRVLQKDPRESRPPPTSRPPRSAPTGNEPFRQPPPPESTSRDGASRDGASRDGASREGSSARPHTVRNPPQEALFS